MLDALTFVLADDALRGMRNDLRAADAEVVRAHRSSQALRRGFVRRSQRARGRRTLVTATARS